MNNTIPSIAKFLDRFSQKNVLLLLGYFLCINVVFIQMPISGSLAGNYDTWANLAMFKDLGKNISHFLFETPIATSNFPCKNTWVLYGLDFFSGFIFLFFKLFRLSDIWAYHFYISTIYTLNSFSIYKLSRLYANSTLSCFVAGFFFSISNFLLANIDNPNIILCFPGFLAVYSLISSIRSKSSNKLTLFFLLLSVQLLLAPVTFVMLVFFWAPYLLFHLRHFFCLIWRNKMVLISILLLGVSMLPYVYYYIILAIPTSEYNVIKSINVTPYLSMNLEDFFRTLTNNSSKVEWSMKIKSGYTGIALFLTVFTGIYFQCNKVRYPLFIFFIGLILSMGPFIFFRGQSLCSSPVLIAYKLLPISDYLRIPSRFYLISMACLLIIFAVGLEILSTNDKRSMKVLYALILFTYIVENLPFPLEKYNSYLIIEKANKGECFIQQSKYKTILNLPSKLFDGKDAREYIYMYFQTINNKNTINGSLLYFPHERLRNDSLAKSAIHIQALKELIRSNGIDLVIFHSDLADSSEMGILSTLNATQFLSKLDSTGPKKIFEVRDL